ncbi:MAG TPA: Wzz/FepE/Etk N-terminal domain-containing protein [Longimicrobiales bacterium]|nr:Wzz/FepE/Etk N-terminal domain-containing protein [Longimicrobiales bacterium]
MSPPSARPSQEHLRLFVLGSAVLAHRRLVLALAVLGAGLGLAAALTGPRTYTSSAIIIPERPANNVSPALALAASQFGITLGNAEPAWGPAIYVELLRSEEFLREIATDTLVVAELDDRPVAVSDLLEIEAPTHALRVERTMRALRRRISVTEDRAIGVVRLAVTTEWPSVSYALAQRLVEDADRFNVQYRQGQAAAERKFVEQQAAEALSALRAAEDELKDFLQQNRYLNGSPELEFERDRLQREVMLRQQLYTGLAQNLEEARIREVRNTPLIGMLERPRLELVPDPRGTVQKVGLGFLGGVVAGLIAAFLAHGARRARAIPAAEATEFFELLEGSAPRFLRSRMGGS